MISFSQFVIYCVTILSVVSLANYQYFEQVILKIIRFTKSYMSKHKRQKKNNS